MLNKRSALRVSEAMDMVEEFIDETAEPLEQAKIVATEARNIADISQHLDESLIRLINDIDRMDYVSNAIKAIRESLADEAVKDERKSCDSSSQPSLVA